VRLVDVPTTGDTGELRREQVKMTTKYPVKNRNDTFYREAWVSKDQFRLERLKYLLLKDNSGSIISNPKPYSIPIAKRFRS